MVRYLLDQMFSVRKAIIFSIDYETDIKHTSDVNSLSEHEINERIRKYQNLQRNCETFSNFCGLMSLSKFDCDFCLVLHSHKTGF